MGWVMAAVRPVIRAAGIHSPISLPSEPLDRTAVISAPRGGTGERRVGMSGSSQEARKERRLREPGGMVPGSVATTVRTWGGSVAGSALVSRLAT